MLGESFWLGFPWSDYTFHWVTRFAAHWIMLGMQSDGAEVNQTTAIQARLVSKKPSNLGPTTPMPGYSWAKREEAHCPERLARRRNAFRKPLIRVLVLILLRERSWRLGQKLHNLAEAQFMAGAALPRNVSSRPTQRNRTRW